MVHYKLYYFNFRGRGELIRFVFAGAGQEFEDFRFEREEWANYKSLSPSGQCPFLEVTDGDSKVLLFQSVSIARYLAKKFNLAGTTDLEQAQVDAYVDQVVDLMNEIVKAHFESDATRKKELDEKLQSEVVPRHLNIFETRLAATGNGRVAASGETYADYAIVAVLEWFGDKRAGLLESFPHLKGLDEKVRSNPGIAAYISKRPTTPF